MRITITNDLHNILKRKWIYVKQNVSIPINSIFEPPCSIKGGRIEYMFKIGAFSYIVNGFFFNTIIGRYCSIAEDVNIGWHSHPLHYVSTSPVFYQNFEFVYNLPPPPGVKINPSDFPKKTPPTEIKKVEIGHDVWIGHGAFILPGVKVGHGAVIGARAVVTKDVPPYAVVVGVPAKVKKYRFKEEIIQDLLDLEWWNYAPWQLKGAPVDDIKGFIDFVKNLKKSNVKPYTPVAIDFSKLIKEVRDG